MTVLKKNVPPGNRTALVTGGARGIGGAAAIELAKLGAAVFINYKSSGADARKTLEAITSFGGKAALLPFDVSDADQCKAAVKTIIEQAGSIDILVNNAGIRRDGLFAMMKETGWREVMDVHLSGFYNLTRPVVRQMIRNRYGRIVNVASTSGITGNAGQVNYSAAKAGVIGATKALAREVGGGNITVNAVAPGFIDTHMLDGLQKDALLDMIPAGRLGAPEEVAYVIAFLCSDKAAYVNGQVIGVNGGMV